MSDRIISGVWKYQTPIRNQAMITEYIGDETDIVVPKEIDGATVTAIGQKAFFGKEITSITLPNTLNFIGSSAFENCCNLKSIKFSRSKIRFPTCQRQFKGCRQLADKQGFLIVRNQLFDYYGNDEDVVIPEGVEFIGEEAFANNQNITSVTFPDTLQAVGKNAFLNCENLSLLELAGFRVPSFEASVFENCPNLVSEDGFLIVEQTLCAYTKDNPIVIVPEGIEEIAPKVFLDKSELVSVTLPASINEIRPLTFVNCPKLSIVKIQQGTVVEEDAFINCPNIVDENGYYTIGNGSGNIVSDSK